MVFDWDDFGANHVISDMCQSHDCRKQLDALHYANPQFKATLFAIPYEMTLELLEWCKANSSWVELAVHGVRHTNNYEMEKMTYEQMDRLMNEPMLKCILDEYFVKGFKAPGWQIGNGVYEWLSDHGWWVADQSYNTFRRTSVSITMPAYENKDGIFYPVRHGKTGAPVEAWHGHTWNCCGNGIEETFEHVKALVEAAKEFKFVSEVLNG